MLLCLNAVLRYWRCRGLENFGIIVVLLQSLTAARLELRQNGPRVFRPLNHAVAKHSSEKDGMAAKEGFFFPLCFFNGPRRLLGTVPIELLYPHPRSCTSTPLAPGDKSFEAAEISGSGGEAAGMAMSVGGIEPVARAVVPVK